MSENLDILNGDESPLDHVTEGGNQGQTRKRIRRLLGYVSYMRSSLINLTEVALGPGVASCRSGIPRTQTQALKGAN